MSVRVSHMLTPAVQRRDGWRMHLRGDMPEDIRHVVHCARDMYSTARPDTPIHKFIDGTNTVRVCVCGRGIETKQFDRSD